MIRSIEFVRTVQEAIPPVLIPVFVFITDLGSPGVLPAVLILWYWLDGRDRRRSAFALAMALCGSGLSLALKGIFELPRPPARLHLIAVSGYGFPSGHAIESTLVYGTLALVLSVGTRCRRAAGAVVMIGLVALSRVVLGVHYPADVVGGVIAGGVFLVGAIRLTDYDPLRGFWLAAVAAVVALPVGDLVSGVTTLGVSVGGALVWWWLGPSPDSKPSNVRLVIVVGAIAVFAGVAIFDGHTRLALRGLTATLAFGGIVALPAIAYRARRSYRRWASPPSR